MTIKRHRVKVSHEVLAKTMQLLLQDDVTAQQLSSHTGVHLITAQEWLRALRVQGVIHVAGWLQDSLGRDAIPVYGMGNMPNQPRAKMTRAEISRRYRERQKEKQ
jgi:hypothetical protein